MCQVLQTKICSAFVCYRFRDPISPPWNSSKPRKAKLRSHKVYLSIVYIYSSVDIWGIYRTEKIAIQSNILPKTDKIPLLQQRRSTSRVTWVLFCHWLNEVCFLVALCVRVGYQDDGRVASTCIANLVGRLAKIWRAPALEFGQMVEECLLSKPGYTGHFRRRHKMCVSVLSVEDYKLFKHSPWSSWQPGCGW